MRTTISKCFGFGVGGHPFSRSRTSRKVATTKRYSGNDILLASLILIKAHASTPKKAVAGLGYQKLCSNDDEDNISSYYHSKNNEFLLSVAPSYIFAFNSPAESPQSSQPFAKR